MDNVVLTEDNFDDLFKPKQNHIDKNAAFSGCMYETFGSELEYVRSCNPKCIWTILDCGDKLYLAAGYHHVNRLGYIITEVPWVTGREEIIYEDVENEEAVPEEMEEDVD